MSYRVYSLYLKYHGCYLNLKCAKFLKKYFVIFLKMDIQKMSNFIYLREIYKKYLKNTLFRVLLAYR